MQRIMIRNALMLCLLLEWGAFAFVIQSKEHVVGQETSKNTIVNVPVVNRGQCRGFQVECVTGSPDDCCPGLKCQPGGGCGVGIHSNPCSHCEKWSG